MLEVRYLFTDLYEDWWGSPQLREPKGNKARCDPQDNTEQQQAPAALKKPSAWSFTLPIDRRYR